MQGVPQVYVIRTQGIGDLYQILALYQRDGNDFNLAYIPSNFTEKPKEVFDPVYMSKLFELGYQMAREGYPWKKVPSGYRPLSPRLRSICNQMIGFESLVLACTLVASVPCSFTLL